MVFTLFGKVVLVYNPSFFFPEADIILTVNVTLLNQSGDWLTVSWEGVPHPSDSDWIGVYSPPSNGGIDPKKHAPIKYQVSVWPCKGLEVFINTYPSSGF